MVRSNNKFLDKISDYYTCKIDKYGQTSLGVDWNSIESQYLRFEQLCKVLDKYENNISIIDLGCGYGALFDYLNERYCLTSYLGVDVSEKMIESAIIRYKSMINARFIKNNKPDIVADFCLASGIFNVRLDISDSEWLDYIVSTIDIMNKNCSLGFSFNCLTSYSDEDKKQDYLYYANPATLFDICKKKYSRNVSLLHDYGLYEFTIIVRKSL